MMEQIATFHTHFGALNFHRSLKARGDTPVMMPVPRSLSASCGTCVHFTQDFDPAVMADEDLDGIYAVENGTYREVFHNKE